MEEKAPTTYSLSYAPSGRCVNERSQLQVWWRLDGLECLHQPAALDALAPTAARRRAALHRRLPFLLLLSRARRAVYHQRSASCKATKCKLPIEKGSLRFSKKAEVGGHMQESHHHPECAFHGA